MTTVRAYIASADPITPTAMEVLSRVKAEVLGDAYSLEFAPAHDALPDRATVFALGKYRAASPNHRVVPAPSVGQIVSHAGIVTRLGQAFRLLVEPPDLPEFQYSIAGTGDLLHLLSRRGEVFAFDIETSGVVDEDGPDPARIISVAIYDGVKAYVIPETFLQGSEHVYSALCGFLEGNGIVTVNGKFDLSYFPDATVPPESHFDVMLAHYLLWPAAGAHGLKDVSKAMFGFDDWDAPAKQYTPRATYEGHTALDDGAWAESRTYPSGSGYERIPRAMLYEYNAFDVYATWHWFTRMRAALAADPDAKRAFDHLMRLSSLFMGVEARGIRLDIPYLEELSATLHVEKAQAEARLDEIAGAPINPRSPKQVKDWFAANGVALDSTNEKTMTEFIEAATETDPERAVEFAQQLLVCRGYAKTLGTYVDGYRAQADSEGRVRPGYKLHASTTGRLGGRGASMLTIPREKRLKRMVIADEGHVVIGADLSQAELRVMAVESADPWLIEAFQPGAGDFFDLLLAQAYPDKDWTALHRAGKDWYNDKRAAMKGVVYGVSFGRGVKAIAHALKIGIHDAQVLIDAFVRPGSEFAMWRQEIERKAVKGEPIVTRFGRHFQSELVTQRNRQNVVNSALSFTSQSTANDICLLATLDVEPKLAQYGAHLMGTVHDAIYVSGPQENAEAVGTLIVEALERAGRETYGDIVRFDADWGYGPSMADV